MNPAQMGEIALSQQLRVATHARGAFFDTHLYQFPQDILMPEDFKCFSLNHAACRTYKGKQNPAVPFCAARQHLIVAWLISATQMMAAFSLQGGQKKSLL